jgi:thioredoxin reductase (NADPH)
MCALFGKKHDKENDDRWFLPRESREHLGKVFAGLGEPVVLSVFSKDGVNDSYNKAMREFVRDLARLSDKIAAEYHEIGSDEAERRGVTRSPSLLINPDKYAVRYTGTPLGEEGRTFIETIVHASKNTSGLSDVARDMLAELSEKREIKVFVNPECPYCPGQVANAFGAAMERPDLVSAECVETRENHDLAEKYEASSLPTTVINETFSRRGLMPPERFIAELVYLRPAEEVLEAVEQKAEQERRGEEPERKDVVIIGGGPAGLTAAIYMERSGMSAVVLERGVLGGQVALTPEVENYPGFKIIPGLKLVDMMAEHAREYSTVNEGEEVLEIKVGRKIEVQSTRAKYECKALILATGATSRLLGVPGETEYYGRGVSVCATCDGWAYKGKKVIVVGGGSSALTEALHLHNLGVDVTLVHRRDELRAEKHLQETVEQEDIPIIWNTVVTRFNGAEKLLNSVMLENVETGEQTEMQVDGAFLAIGWLPNTDIAEQVGLKLNEWGFIEVDRGMRTNIPRIYAAGDVNGGVRQIVTAVGDGATAALSAFEDLSNPYWMRTDKT